MITFRVDGNPLPKQSFRVTKTRGKVYGYTDKRVEAWQDTVGWMARDAMRGESPMEGDLEVVIEFTRENRKRVDLDNLSKAVLDAMNGIVYRDDQQIVRLRLEKKFDKEAGIIVTVAQDGECPY